MGEGKVAIYGAGSLGTVLGAFMTQNGVDVELVNRNKAHVEALREKDVFDLSTVAYAVVETNGSVSVLLKPEVQPVPLSYVEKHPKDEGIPYVLISDGVLLKTGLRDAGLSLSDLDGILRRAQVKRKDVFLLTCDKNGKTVLIRKEAGA